MLKQNIYLSLDVNTILPKELKFPNIPKISDDYTF